MLRWIPRRHGGKRFRWLDSGLLPLASAVMRAAWLTPLIHLVFALPLVVAWSGRYPGGLVLGLLLAASALADALGTRPGGRVVAAAVGLLVVAAVTAHLFAWDAAAPGAWLRGQYEALVDLRVAVPANLVAIVVTAALWYGGLTIDWADSSALWRNFVLGIVVLGGMLLLDSGAMAMADLRAATLAFLVSGMLSLALLSAAEMLNLQRARGRAAPYLNRYWLVSAGSVVLAILVFGWLLTQIVSPQAAADALRAVGGVIGVVLDLLSTLIAWVAFALLWLLWPLIMELRELLVAAELPIPAAGQQQESPFGEVPIAPRALAPGVQDALRVVALVALVAGIALAFYLAERRRRRRPPEQVEQRESILSMSLLRAQWEDWRRRRQRKPLAPFLSLEGVEAPRRVVRALYQRMLARVGALGLGRTPGQTALRHVRMLERNLPAVRADLRTLGDAYQVARYASTPPSVEEVEAARRAWERLDVALGAQSTKPARR
ncbi:MAG TPA: DUF4129 domain-containing protein [Chloroflexi bacterium]|jgi:hypothetical protein|nr:DUF4129 domain-containing protein [Chloroflexota bacterium]